MPIGSDYPSPVTVNGFQCRNCTDVAYAKKHIDPAHPKSGPYGINAKDDPSLVNKSAPSSAVVFGGSLSPLNSADAAHESEGAFDADHDGDLRPQAPGAQIDISA